MLIGSYDKVMVVIKAVCDFDAEYLSSQAHLTNYSRGKPAYILMAKISNKGHIYGNCIGD